MRTAKGQSIVEYAVLAMLIVVGTIVMGPYLIRSIGAHFKLWQETVDDSVNDRLKTVPISVSQVCNQSDYITTGCGAHLREDSATCAGSYKGKAIIRPSTSSQCAPSQRYIYKTGSPSGCYYCEGCFDDPTCCEIFTACVSAPCCGKKPLLYPGFYRSSFLNDSNGNPTLQMHPVDRNGNEIENDVADPSIPINQSCYYGEMLLYNQCDSNKVRCQRNADCNPNCIGNLPVNSSGVTTAHLCDPNPQDRLIQDEKISWFNPCPAPPPDTPGQGGEEIKSLTVYYRGTNAIELYTSEGPDPTSGDWDDGNALKSVGFDEQCEEEPEHLSFWETLGGFLGFGGSRTFECLFWLGPIFCYHEIPLPVPAPKMAFDHGFWGCARADDPKDMSWSAGFIQMALDILFGFGGGNIIASIISNVDHPEDDWGWNGCGNETQYNRHESQCDSPPSGIDVFRKMKVDIKTPGTTYLMAYIAEDTDQPWFTVAPITPDHIGAFEVFVEYGGKYYCFKPTTETYSRTSDHRGKAKDIKDAAGDSCKYLTVHGDLEMDVNQELLKLEIPVAEDHGEESVPIRYNCDECEGKCGPNPPACRAKCDTGYSEIMVPDPDNPGNNIVTCIPCTNLNCNYTIECKQGGLTGANSSFIGGSCEAADELVGCVSTGTGYNHGASAISFNSCYATSDYPRNVTGATDPANYGCRLNCRKSPGIGVNGCVDRPQTNN